MPKLIATYNELIVALRADRDEDTRQFFHDDFRFYEDPGMPYGGEFEGADSFIQTRHKVMQFYKLEIESKCESPEEDRLVIVLKLTGHDHAPTKGIVTWVCVVWRFRDGRAEEARVLYYDTPRSNAAIRGA
jgi:hypothetical protein